MATYQQMETLLGYGHPAARLWVVGLEEHCGNDAEIERRVTARAQNQTQFLDRVEFHRDVGIEPGHVPVWLNAQAIYERWRGCSTDVGRSDPVVCDVLLAELFPLPRPRHDSTCWPTPYEKFFPSFLLYRECALGNMPTRLLSKVDVHKPQAVILHGTAAHNRWVDEHASTQGGWQTVSLDAPGARRPMTARFRVIKETVWVRTWNLINNGFIRWTPERIGRLSEELRRRTQQCGMSRQEGH